MVANATPRYRCVGRVGDAELCLRWDSSGVAPGLLAPDGFREGTDGMEAEHVELLGDALTPDVAPLCRESCGSVIRARIESDPLLLALYDCPTAERLWRLASPSLASLAPPARDALLKALNEKGCESLARVVSGAEGGESD